MCRLTGRRSSTPMRLLIVFARAYPWRTGLMLGCLVLAAVAEGLGLSSVLPAGRPRDRAPAGRPPKAQISRTVASTCSRSSASSRRSACCSRRSSRRCSSRRRSSSSRSARSATPWRTSRPTFASSCCARCSMSRWAYYVRKPVGVLANSFATEASRASQAYLSVRPSSRSRSRPIVYFGVAIATSWQATIGAATARHHDDRHAE